MKFIILLILTLFISYVYAQTNSTSGPSGPTTLTPLVEDLRTNLLKQLEDLKIQIKTVVEKLQSENREYLAQTLLEEWDRLEKLLEELKTTNPDHEVLTILEQKIIRAGRRLAIEEEAFKREIATQEAVLSDANTLKSWIAIEVKDLEATHGPRRQQALEIAKALIREDKRLEEMCQELVKAQTVQRIGAYETEIRAIEARIHEELKRLDFHPPDTSRHEPIH